MRSVFLVIAALVPLAAAGHHGWSGYDASRPMKITGKIVESGYEHPHGHIRLEVPGKIWHVVLAPPSRMQRRGLAQEALRPGASVTVEGYPSREDPQEMRAERISAGEKTVELR